MADNYYLCIIAAMDRLWFRQIILFSEPISVICSKCLKTTPPSSESLSHPSSNLPISPLSDEVIFSKSFSATLDHSSPLTEEEISPDSSAITLEDESNNEDEEEGIEQKQRPTRWNVNTSRTRSCPSSPSTQKRPRRLRNSVATSRLQKTMSCKSLWELELEEVKGFMDLGFIFEREHLSPRMMSVIPGLQRPRGHKKEQKAKLMDATDGATDDEVDEEKRGIIRPYLSEAWLIKRPDSPLLNLRMPRASAAADMKKHLRCWAKTVASVIHQES